MHRLPFHVQGQGFGDDDVSPVGAVRPRPSNTRQPSTISAPTIAMPSRRRSLACASGVGASRSIGRASRTGRRARARLAEPPSQRMSARPVSSLPGEVAAYGVERRASAPLTTRSSPGALGDGSQDLLCTGQIAGHQGHGPFPAHRILPFVSLGACTTDAIVLLLPGPSARTGSLTSNDWLVILRARARRGTGQSGPCS